MRGLAILLCLVSSARADLAAAPAATGDAMDDFPATDGKQVLDRPVQLSGRIHVDLIDVESRARTPLTFTSMAELRRRFAGFEAMRERELMVWKNWSESVTLPHDVHIGAQRISYDEQTARLALRGPVQRRVDLTMHDVCMGEKRQSAPDDLQVYAARGVVLIEAVAHGGSCMCDNRSMRRLVTASRSFTLR